MCLMVSNLSYTWSTTVSTRIHTEVHNLGLPWTTSVAFGLTQHCNGLLLVLSLCVFGCPKKLKTRWAVEGTLLFPPGLKFL
jgi:hypothetical protein